MLIKRITYLSSKIIKNKSLTEYAAHSSACLRADNACCQDMRLETE